MDERDGTWITRPSGVNTWRAGCGESRTSGSEGGPGKPTNRKVSKAPRSDPYTYVRTWSGFVYVAFIVEVFAQRILAWHAATTKHTELVMIGLRMALWQREHEGHPIVPGELIQHSDTGSQYTSIHFTEHLALTEILPSIGTVGDALMETINGLYKAECISHHDLPRRPLPLDR